MSIEARLKELNIVLPTPPAPVASYVPYVISGNQVFISGQVTIGPRGLEYVGTRSRPCDQRRHSPQRRLLGGGRPEVMGIRRRQVRPLIRGADPRRLVRLGATVSDRGPGAKGTVVDVKTA